MKYIIKKYSKRLIGLAIFVGGLTTLYILAVQNTTELRFDDQLATQFGSGIFTYREDIDFKYGGNKKIGIYLPRSVETLTTPEIVVLDGGNTGVCYGKIRGIYYNNERGERVRPLDQNTLTGLQAIHGSYSGMQLSGGLFTSCTGLGGASGNVYGQLTITYHDTVYYLMGGTTYNFTANTHGTGLDGSLQRANNNLSGYLWDNYGGIGLLIHKAIYQGPTILTGMVNSGSTVTLPDSQTIIYSSESSSDYLLFSSNQFIVTEANWNGIILPPTPATGTGAANSGEAGLGRGNIYFSIQAGATGTSLIASGGSFIINLVVPLGQAGNELSIYRSQDGITRIGNTPDTACTLDSNKYCQFRTDHLSFFAGIYIYRGSTISTGTQGGSARLVKDNCTRNNASKYNLSGANEDGIDYSPSYYDRDCEGPESTIQYITIPPLCSAYTDELNGAYEFARSFNITTINQCRNVNIYGNLLRKDMAKMMVNYAENVFNRTGIRVDDPRCESFSDMINETEETQMYIQKACEYGLMGLKSDGITPQTKFDPYGIVNRAQFGTVLSRFIRLLDYSVGNDSKIPYYTKHLQALQRVGIMKKISAPDMKEMRGWVMLMMQRIYKKVQ